MLDLDGQHLCGWLTNQHVLRTIARKLAAAEPEITAGQRAAEWADPHAGQADHDPGTQLPRYHIIEHTLTADSPAIGRLLSELPWPPGHLPVSILHHRRLIEPASGLRLAAGDRVHLLAPLPDQQRHRSESATTRHEPS